MEGGGGGGEDARAGGRAEVEAEPDAPVVVAAGSPHPPPVDGSPHPPVVGAPHPPLVGAPHDVSFAAPQAVEDNGAAGAAVSVGLSASDVDQAVPPMGAEPQPDDSVCIARGAVGIGDRLEGPALLAPVAVEELAHPLSARRLAFSESKESRPAPDGRLSRLRPVSE